ncbi:YslB family protein [Pontibacillus yanchengensis]|nr:YslB family protein [Pontibacillus yanchengensis]
MNDQIANLFDQYQDIPSSLIGHEVLRTQLLPDLLGKESDTILYIMGKNLARYYPCASLDEIETFFTTMGWDHITLEKEKKNEYHFSLKGELTTKRLTYNPPYSYKLEAGFLAEQITLLKEKQAECAYETDQRNQTVSFEVVT